MMYVVTLHLARTATYLEGYSGCGYEIHAPLDSRLYLDAKAWRRSRGRCRVRRFWTSEADRYGWLIHRAGGPGGATWCIDYDDTSKQHDELGYRLDGHRFGPGDYVSLRAADGELLPFRAAALKLKSPRSGIAQRLLHATCASYHRRSA
ncbi:hypothetical protein [Bosea sp. F3-2]|uniref:hypothetical protein n=1 Tax=Bosea sp. F3-2 TaxID=2599640 RepID=UPI00165513A3|nr:hypothetical protein [Bosea sp. F3-2]